MRALLQTRDARVLLAGQTASLFGDRMLFLAMGIWVKTLTGSNAAAGLTFFFFAAPTLLGPLGGLVVDRLRRRRLLVGTNLVLAAAVLPLLLVFDASRVWVIDAVMVLSGAGAVVLSAGLTALLPQLLAPDLLGEANSALSFAGQGLRLVAPLAGAALFTAVGARAIVLVDAATFLVAAATLAVLRVDDARPERSPATWQVDVVAGALCIRDTPALRDLVIACAGGFSVIGLTESAGFAVVQALGRPAAFLGVLVSLQGAGAVVAALVAPAVLRRLGEGRTVAAGLLACGAAIGALLPLDTDLTVLAMPVLGLGVTWIVVGASTLVQRGTPPEVLGRVGAAVDVSVSLPQTVFIALGAVLVGVVDVRILLAVMTVAMGAGGAWLGSRRVDSEVADPAGSSA